MCIRDSRPAGPHVLDALEVVLHARQRIQADAVLPFEKARLMTAAQGDDPVSYTHLRRAGLPGIVRTRLSSRRCPARRNPLTRFLFRRMPVKRAEEGKGLGLSLIHI